MIHHGDCIEVMAGMPADSVDAVVTDPPYGLEFMGKGWDKFGAVVEHPDDGEGPWGRTSRVRYGNGFRRSRNPADVERDDVFGRTSRKGPEYRAGHSFQAWCEAWGREALRVTKSGGYLLAFGGTRTHHRLVCGLEDAGWIIRDELDWIYASGFPKGKANLKPAHEPIVLARKPGPLRPLAIDECRIGVDGGHEGAGPGPSQGILGDGLNGARAQPVPGMGRWPSNLLLSDPELFDVANPGVVGSGSVDAGGGYGVRGGREGDDWGMAGTGETVGYGDSGGYSRFFIIPKADRADREPVLRGQVAPKVWSDGRDVAADYPSQRGKTSRENGHPTVKPTDLMRHLVRLVTPVGGTVLDPFLGSGSTALACELEGFPWVGIEKEAEYVAIAEARLNGVQRGLGLDVPAPTRVPSRTGQQGPTPETNGQARWTEWREDSESPEDDAA